MWLEGTWRRYSGASWIVEDQRGKGNLHGVTWPTPILKGASLNDACGEESGLQTFLLPSNESIPRMADLQAPAQLPTGLMPTCAWRLWLAYLTQRGDIPASASKGIYKPFLSLPAKPGDAGGYGEEEMLLAHPASALGWIWTKPA